MHNAIRPLIGTLASFGVFTLVMTVARDLHIAFAMSGAERRYQSCIDEAIQGGSPTFPCLDAISHAQRSMERWDLLIAMVLALVAVGLAWLLAWPFYFRNRRRDEELRRRLG